MWVYIRTDLDLWTVGFHDPDGKWYTDSDWDTKGKARKLSKRRIKWITIETKSTA